MQATIETGTPAIPEVAMPLVVAGPWTREAFVRYFRRAVKVRNWLP